MMSMVWTQLLESASSFDCLVPVPAAQPTSKPRQRSSLSSIPRMCLSQGQYQLGTASFSQEQIFQMGGGPLFYSVTQRDAGRTRIPQMTRAFRSHPGPAS